MSYLTSQPLIKAHPGEPYINPIGTVRMNMGNSLPEGWIYFDEIYRRDEFPFLAALLDMTQPIFYLSDEEEFILFDIWKGNTLAIT